LAEITHQFDEANFRVVKLWQPARGFKQIHSLAAVRL
jgi:hypothetical protein